MTFGKTGEKCLISGKYRCFGEINDHIHLMAGQQFPDVQDSTNAFWILLQKADDHKNDNSTEAIEKKYDPYPI